MLLVSEPIQTPSQTSEIVKLPFGNLIKLKNPCQCCHRRVMDTHGICNDCYFFCHEYCEFNNNSLKFK